MKKKEAANEKLIYEIAQENKRLIEPLTKALKEVEGLRKDLTNYEKVGHHLLLETIYILKKWILIRVFLFIFYEVPKCNTLEEFSPFGGL